MIKRSFAGLALAVAMLTLHADAARALTFTCSTIARRNSADPLGGAFKSSFKEPSINGSGDVVFVSKPLGAEKRLYLYPGAGAASVVATAGDAAPGGSTFSDFETPSINDDGDLAFFGDLAVGEAVLVRESGGGLVEAARTTGAAPGGGTWAVFPQVSAVNAAGDVAFLASVDGGQSGVFLYDTSAATVSPIAVIGDSSGDGRQFCSFSSVDLGDTGTAALHAVTKIDCNDTGEVERDGIYEKQGATFISVAQEGGATPVGGTTFARFFGIPEVNASDIVGFRAKTTGVISVTGLFNFDPTGPTTTLLAATGDAAPGTGGGTYRTIAFAHLTDGARQAFRGRVRSGTAREGIFLVDGTDEPVVLNTDPVPTDLFSAGSVYRKIIEEFGIDRAGTHVAFSAKVRSSTQPHSQIGLFRCTGS